MRVIQAQGGWPTRGPSSTEARPTGRSPPDAVLIATGATPRILPDAEPDGERILTWRQLYDLDELPEELIVVGSGVTGADSPAPTRRSARR